MANFRKGGKQAEEIAKQQQAAFSKVNWLDLADGESVVVRLLDDSDDWLYALQHNFVPTKGAPADATGEERSKFPTHMSGVCRMDEGFVDPDTGKRQFADCFICDEMRKDDGKKYTPGLRLWARAVEREPVIGTQEHVDAGHIREDRVGKVVGYTDKLVEVPILDDDKKPTGKSTLQRKIYVLRFGLKNFFGAFQGAYDVYETVLDRDYKITRKGSGTKTEYSIVSLNPTPGFDLRDPETHAKYEQYCTDAGIDLPALIEGMASDDFYGRFFDTRVESKARSAKKDDDETSGAPADQQAKPEETGSTVSPEAVAAMRARVLGGNTPSAPAEETSFI
jgi:hypothetical protein